MIFAFSLLPVSPKEWIELATTGEWKGHPDGEFALSEQDLHDMVSNFEKDPRGRLVVDYEHQTLRSGKNGQPAPAAGWITALEVVQGEDGPKLNGRVEWTRSATTAIANNEYAYISPVIVFKAKDRKTGKPTGTRLHSAALTNSPFLNELAAVAATLEPPEMTLLSLLIPLLMLAPTATEEDAVASVDRLSKGRKTACKALGLSDDAKDEDIEAAMDKVVTPLALGRTAMKTLKLSDTTPTDQAEAAFKPVLEHAGFIAATDHAKVVKELADLRADLLVRDAIAEGKVIPANEPWARPFAASDPEGFKVWAKYAPKVVSPAEDRKGPSKTVTLTDTDREAIRQLGLTEEQYLKAKENRA